MKWNKLCDIVIVFIKKKEEMFDPGILKKNCFTGTLNDSGLSEQENGNRMWRSAYE